MNIMEKIRVARTKITEGLRVDGSAKENKILSAKIADKDDSYIDTVDFSLFDLKQAMAQQYTSHILTVNLGMGFAYKYFKNDDGAVEKFTNSFSFFQNVIGSNGGDILVGNDLDNVIIGLNGEDEINGGKGNDISIGGQENTTYSYLDKNFGNDTVYDEDGNKDIIDLSWNFQRDISRKNTFLHRLDNELIITFASAGNEAVPNGSITIADFFSCPDNQIEIIRLKELNAQQGIRESKDFDLVKLTRDLKESDGKQSISVLLANADTRRWGFSKPLDSITPFDMGEYYKQQAAAFSNARVNCFAMSDAKPKPMMADSIGMSIAPA